MMKIEKMQKNTKQSFLSQNNFLDLYPDYLFT